MADRIRHCLRGTDDLGARVGGDELLVVLHGVQDLANAVAVAEKLRLSAAEPIAVPGGTIRTTVSIGVTLARPGEPTGTLVARADEAMYRAKQHGRNQVITIDS
jgi:diguanylate cyclase (GGDEF)-like protein